MNGSNIFFLFFIRVWGFLAGQCWLNVRDGYVYVVRVVVFTRLPVIQMAGAGDYFQRSHRPAFIISRATSTSEFITIVTWSASRACLCVGGRGLGGSGVERGERRSEKTREEKRGRERETTDSTRTLIMQLNREDNHINFTVTYRGSVTYQSGKEKPCNDKGRKNLTL